MEQPGVEAESHLCQPAGAGPEFAGAHHVLERAAVAIVDLVARVPGGGVPDPPEPAPAGGIMGCQDLLHGAAQHHVGVADDPRDGRVAASIGRIGLPRHEHRLAHRLHVLWALLVVIRLALHEHRLHHVVGAGQIRPQLGCQVGAAAPMPEMVVSIDDQPVGVDRVLPAQREPVEPVELHRVVISAAAAGAAAPTSAAVSQSPRGTARRTVDHLPHLRCAPGTSRPLRWTHGGGDVTDSSPVVLGPCGMLAVT